MSIVTGTARAVAGVIALVIWVGLAIQFRVLVDEGRSAPETLWVMLRFFTITTNLLMAAVLTGIAFGKSRFGSPALLGLATLSLVLVGILFSLLLRGLVELSGSAKLADFILHDLTPILAGLFWLVFAPKGALQGRHALLWITYPLAYFCYAVARGAVDNKYPYPFMNVAEIGWAKTAINALLITVVFLAAGYALVWLDRLLARRSVSA
jgi:hypothetical protein